MFFISTNVSSEFQRLNLRNNASLTEGTTTVGEGQGRGPGEGSGATGDCENQVSNWTIANIITRRASHSCARGEPAQTKKVGKMSNLMGLMSFEIVVCDLKYLEIEN